MAARGTCGLSARRPDRGVRGSRRCRGRAAGCCSSVLISARRCVPACGRGGTASTLRSCVKHERALANVGPIRFTSGTSRRLRGPVGQTESFSKTVSSSDVVGSAEVTGDRNLIHLSEHFAAQTTFGTRIAHGLYTASLISALGDASTGAGRLLHFTNVEFRAPVRIGDTVSVSVTVAELLPKKFRARLLCACKVSENVVLDGAALVRVPSRSTVRRTTARVLADS
jgi:3-hydroxybutyryl-CoA dehydratase